MEDMNLDDIHNKKLIRIRMLLIALAVYNLIKQIIYMDRYGELGQPTSIIMVVNWILWLTFIILVVLSFRRQKPQLVYIQLYVILARNVLAIMDFEEKRNNEWQFFNGIYALSQITTIAVITLCLNFVTKNGYLILLNTNLSCILSIWGLLAMSVPVGDASTIDVLYKILNEPKYRFNFVNLYLHLVPGHLIMVFMLNSMEKEILQAWHQKSTIQKEMDQLLSVLQEAVITKDKDNKLSYTNEKGHKIIRMITKFLYDSIPSMKKLKEG